MDKSKLDILGKEIKQRLERERCAACNNRKAIVTVTMSDRGPKLKIAACCFNFEKKLQEMGKVMWQEFLQKELEAANVKE
jgi:uncharacterized protein YqeY